MFDNPEELKTQCTRGEDTGDKGGVIGADQRVEHYLLQTCVKVVSLDLNLEPSRFRSDWYRPGVVATHRRALVNALIVKEQPHIFIVF